METILSFLVVCLLASSCSTSNGHNSEGESQLGSSDGEEQSDQYCEALDVMFQALKKQEDVDGTDHVLVEKWHESIVEAEKVAIDEHKWYLNRYATHAEEAVVKGFDQDLAVISGTFIYGIQSHEDGIGEYAYNCGVESEILEVFEGEESTAGESIDVGSENMLTNLDSGFGFNSCDRVDLESLSDSYGRDLYTRYIDNNYPGSPYRNCEFFDDETDDLVLNFAMDADGDQTFQVGISPELGRNGYRELAGNPGVSWKQGSAAFSLEGEKQAGVMTVKNGIEYYLSGQFPSAAENMDGTRASDEYVDTDDLAIMMEQIAADIAPREPNPELISSCADISIKEFAGSTLSEYEYYEFDRVATCTAKTESNEMLSISVDSWSSASGYLEDIIDSSKYTWSEPKLVDSASFDISYYTESHPTGAWAKQRLMADEFYGIAGNTWVHVVVLRPRYSEPHQESELEQIASTIINDSFPIAVPGE